MTSWIPRTTDRLLAGRATRRRILAGIAVGLVAPVAFAPEATISVSTDAQDRGGVIMGRQADETVTTDYLTVPGARLYYEVSGSGPVLLLIPGGPVDAGGFAPLVPFLEDSYTVVRYDPRGISRSRVDGPAEDVAVGVHADDAQRLLQAMGDEPAYVLGSSGGAVIGLALVERHPEQVQALVAHEPPLTELLPEGDARRTANQEIYDTYLQEGAGPAMEKFMAVAEMDEEVPAVEMSPEEQEFMAQQMASVQQNLDFFLGHYLMPITTYEPDIATLQAASAQVLVGVGEASGDQEAAETARALAERLGTPAVIFPGDHMGMATHPEAFAESLHEVFQGR